MRGSILASSSFFLFHDIADRLEFVTFPGSNNVSRYTDPFMNEGRKKELCGYLLSDRIDVVV